MMINATIKDVSATFRIVDYDRNDSSNNTNQFNDDLFFSLPAFQILLQRGKDDDSDMNSSYEGLFNFVPAL